ncbi:MAG: hypothetical protein GX493_09225 [Firmicutes bacterium]|nr:hypothetical protein [Bacillota bacterium]
MRNLEPWLGLRLGPVFVVFALALAVLLAGQSLLRYLGFRRPLTRELSAIRGIKGFSLRETPDGLTVEVTIDRVDDLEATAEEVLSVVSARARRPVAALVFRDRREGLGEAYYELRFTLEEAVATGGYGKLRPELARLAEKYGLTKARVYPGRDFLYVQLERGGAYLYEALPRNPASRSLAEGGAA